jgi:hypothetical protein
MMINRHQISQNSLLEDLESLITIAECDDFIHKSIRTPVFEDLGKGDDLNIIAQGCDLMSDGQ